MYNKLQKSVMNSHDSELVGEKNELHQENEVKVERIGSQEQRSDRKKKNKNCDNPDFKEISGG